MLKFFLAIAFCFSLYAEEISYKELYAVSEQQPSLVEFAQFFDLPDDTVFSSLDGGLSRAKLYRFEHDGQTLVLRFLALGPNQPLGVRQGEIQALKAGSALGIAPECVFSDSNALVVVMPFLSEKFTKSDEEIAELGKYLRSLHHYEGAYPAKNTFEERLQKQYQKGVTSGMAYPTGFDAEVKKVLSEKCDRKKVPCHADLNPSNILKEKGHLKLIDWTCATLDDLYLDLSYLCVLAHFSRAQEEILLRHYFGREATSEEHEILRQRKAKIYLLTAAIWLRFAETELSFDERQARLDAILNSGTLKPADDYLREGVVVNLNTSPKIEVRNYGLSFYQAYLNGKKAS